MRYIDFINNNITLISLFLNVIVIINFVKNIFDFVFKKYYIKKVLGYNNELVSISCYDENNKYLSFHDIEAVNNIIAMFFEINQKFAFTRIERDVNNEMCIGGFLVNRKINTYFVKYFKDFKYLMAPDWKAKYGDNPFIEYVPEKNGYKIKDVVLTCDSSTDYAFLIKLTKEDLQNAKKVIHIIHGSYEISTIRASEYLATHYKQIYKEFKNRHYFFAIEINRLDGSINYSKGIIDFTDKMFNY